MEVIRNISVRSHEELEMSVMLKTSKLEKIYRRGAEEVLALKGIDLEIHGGDFAAISGPSGSGKSTLLQIMGCLDKPTSGELEIDGSSVASLSRAETDALRSEKIGFVFQQFQLISSLTVQENVLLPLLFSRQKPDPEYLQHILETVGMAHRKKHLPDQLSGGEMQRVALARALINRPSMILADEPTGNLDSENSNKIFDLLGRLNSQGVTVVFVTHNDEFAGLADMKIILCDGRIENVVRRKQRF